MEQLTLTAHARETSGKGVARKLRKNQQIPAVLYGPGAAPINLTLEYADMKKVLKQAGSENILLGLFVEKDGKSEKHTVMLKELQVDPLKDRFLHADFHEISMDKEININVSIRLTGTPVGVTNGGILQHVRRELAIACLPDKMIDAVECDVSGLDIGDAVHIEELSLPEDIRSLDEGHLTVAVVAAPTVSAEKEEEEELEGEVSEEAAAAEPEASESEES